VPATSANLGPGFDCLGLALDLYLSVSCRVRPDGLAIMVSEPSIETDERNLVYRAMAAVFASTSQPVPGLAIDIQADIPLARGLGSSSAAIIAGVMLANRILDEPYDRERLLQLALPLEGHPDNIAPAMFGGLVVSGLAGNLVLAERVSLARQPRVALFIPDTPMSTAEARRVLPASYSRADAVFNTGRSALLVAALASGDIHVLRQAMEDRLHQPYRAEIFPALPKLINAALEAGASGAALSGAGSTVIALCDGDPAPVAEAMARVGEPGRAATAQIDLEGAQLTT